MYKIERAFTPDGRRLSSVIEVSHIRRSIHLHPDFGSVAPRHWTTDNVLEECSAFYLNDFSDNHSYITLF